MTRTEALIGGWALFGALIGVIAALAVRGRRRAR